MAKKKDELALLHSSAAEYLTFVAATGDSKESMEMRYEDENIWLTQKMMSALYDVSVAAINQHLKTIFDDGELDADSVIKKYLTTAADGKRYKTMHYNLQAERKIPMSMADWATRLDGFLEFNGNELLIGPGKVSAEQAKLHAETEFEKYRITQDRLFTSDFDRFLLETKEEAHE